MFCPCTSLFWLVVYQCLHADGDEGEGGVIMCAVQVCVGQDVGICVALAEEEELSLGLGDGLAPQAEGEGAGGAAEDGNKMILPELDGLLGDVAAMVVGGNELVSHS